MPAFFIAGLFFVATRPCFAKEDCIPPSFYTSLPRDQDWFYGTAKDPDTDKAREHAIRNLGRQVSGEIEGWDEADVEKIAGPGHDRAQVAINVGKLLPQSSLLAGWEQDDFARCNGYSYVLVRIEKEQVRRYVKENQNFKDALLTSLAQRVEKVEKDVSALQSTTAQQKIQMSQIVARLAALEKRSSLLKPVAPADVSTHDEIGKKIRLIKTEIAQGRPPREVETNLLAAEGAFDRLSKRLALYDAKHKEVQGEREAGFKAETDAKTAAILNKIWYGPLKRSDFVQVAQYYESTKQYQRLHEFSKRMAEHIAKKGVAEDAEELAYRKIADGNWGTAVLVGFFSIEADNGIYQEDSAKLRGSGPKCPYCASRLLQDDRRMLHDGEVFLKEYPNNHFYEGVRMSMERTMMRDKQCESGFCASN
jgi:hypothetical protein